MDDWPIGCYFSTWRNIIIHHRCSTVSLLCMCCLLKISLYVLFILSKMEAYICVMWLVRNHPRFHGNFFSSFYPAIFFIVSLTSPVFQIYSSKPFWMLELIVTEWKQTNLHFTTINLTQIYSLSFDIELCQCWVTAAPKSFRRASSVRGKNWLKIIT